MPGLKLLVPPGPISECDALAVTRETRKKAGIT